MKKFLGKWLVLALIFSASTLFAADESSTQKTLNVGLVNFKLCVENSKIGKQEQAAFEAIKKKMEEVLDEKEKALNAIADKLNDPDQLDLMSPDEETAEKRKFRTLTQDLSELQNQAYQSLNQTNYKVVQSLAEKVAEASEAVAKENKIDIVLNDEIAFFYTQALDISSKVIEKMDQLFDQEAKNASPTKVTP